ncbi:MAG: propionyl-CoA carboxylase, partial [Deltaproteobacteria bacterium]|nr:propionyl-CoA carboxylase [Deltaproteobacteria bacterium]
MGQWMQGYLERLSAVHRENLLGGGEDRQRLQHALGKRTARERISSLVDPGTF